MVAAIAVVPSLAGAGIEAELWADVERRFREQLSPLRLFPGAVLAVYHGGQLVLDLGGGYADTQRGERVGDDTLFPIFSGTKPFGAVALWQQIERGRLGLDEPVATYWPDFGQQGKQQVLVRHILSHRGGFPTTPAALPREQWGNWEAATAAVAAMPLEHEPGTVSAYHFLTQHWVCGELIRRLDGRDYANCLREEITDPLGLHDTYFALPADLEQRLVKLHATDGTDEWGRDALRTMHD
jgi:CubicO group peptidase (beta-lactamase class C family)